MWSSFPVDDLDAYEHRKRRDRRAGALVWFLLGAGWMFEEPDVSVIAGIVGILVGTVGGLLLGIVRSREARLPIRPADLFMFKHILFMTGWIVGGLTLMWGSRYVLQSLGEDLPFRFFVSTLWIATAVMMFMRAPDDAHALRSRYEADLRELGDPESGDR